jgi:hypothetical protein
MPAGDDCSVKEHDLIATPEPPWVLEQGIDGTVSAMVCADTGVKDMSKKLAPSSVTRCTIANGRECLMKFMSCPLRVRWLAPPFYSRTLIQPLQGLTLQQYQLLRTTGNARGILWRISVV